MKKGLVFIAVCLFIFPEIKAQESTGKVKWYTFEEAVKLVQKEPKKLFIDVYTDWCGWCKRMDENTFNHPVIAEYLNTHFYAVKFNAESTEPVEFGGKTFINEGKGNRHPHQLAIALLQGRMSYPSVAYMNEDLQLLTAVAGYMEPKAIEPILSYFATDKYKTVEWNEFQKNFLSSIR
ncbi:MAG TPA: DUF255 domain-containing protein [Bacteroidetes bacterium]|nr:DUF255 domain-containing protein [Bacteroidota bacterium]